MRIHEHGYIEIIETWGSDERIIEAARMSTNKGFVNWEQDKKLLNYLYTNKHSTPFEMAGAVIEVKAPIFVFREWHRHRTQSYSELSARYTPLPDENYLPSLERIKTGVMTATSNRQASGTTALANDNMITAWLHRLKTVYADAQLVYEEGIAFGIPKELARLPVPVARYSRMRASANLRNWLAFLTLRTAPNAQEEIRVYADALESLLRNYFPRTIELFRAENRK